MTQYRFINPVFLLQIAQHYLSGIDRLWRLSEDELRRYQDRAFKKVVSYAYTIPLYHEKYKQAGIKPHDITGISDISKLPFISKEDLRNGYPQKIRPQGTHEQDFFLLSTSGSTGKPVFLYVDALSAIMSLIGFVRTLRAYGGRWNNSKIAMIIDTAPGSIEQTVFGESALPFVSKFMKMNNIKYIDITEKPERILQQLDAFQPEFIGSDPNMFRDLAHLRNQGLGNDLKITTLVSGGSMLDQYSKDYIEKSFGAPIKDTYGTTEAGPLGFQCATDEIYHIHSDFVYLEVLDAHQEPVASDNTGRLVVTKLYGQATPIIRYRGIEDYITPTTEKPCGCSGQALKHIEGRLTDLLVLPDNSLLSPLALTGIPAKVMENDHTYKIKQFQIIQHKKDDVEVLVVIDQKLKNQGPPVKTLKDDLKTHFTNRIGQGVTVRINEVDEIQKGHRHDYVKVVISHVHQRID